MPRNPLRAASDRAAAPVPVPRGSTAPSDPMEASEAEDAASPAEPMGSGERAAATKAALTDATVASASVTNLACVSPCYIHLAGRSGGCPRALSRPSGR